MSQKRKILFPTDFSVFAERARAVALHLAELWEAELYLIHAIEPPTGLAKMWSTQDEDDIRKKANEKLDEEIKKYDNPKIVFGKLVKIGKPYKAIVEAANELSPDMIIMGTQGAEGHRGPFLGSNANYVIKHAPCPVMSIREKPDHIEFTKILLPLDLTKETGEKVAWGIEFAKIFNSELVLFSVLQTTDEAAISKLKGRLNKALEYIHSKGIKNVHTEMVGMSDSVAHTTLDYCIANDVDLICVMTQQEEANLADRLVGTNADSMANHARIPIMSIRPVKQYHSQKWISSHFT